MKKWSSVLIITGILLILYPLFDRAYTWYWQQRIFSEWQEYFPPGETDQQERTGTAKVNGGLPGTAGGGSDWPVQERTKLNLRGTAGILIIDKIDLQLPILCGTSNNNLKIGAGLMDGSPGFGEIGNTLLLAHRSHTYGRFFNRLDELEPGDVIDVITPENNYKYTVYRKIIVEPTDYSILEGNKEEKILSLVTCHPVYNSTHRLVVQAKL